MSITAAEAVTWRFEFMSSNRGSGYFEVDPTNLIIPESAAHPTNFNVIAADININGGQLGFLHFTGNLYTTACTPGECSVTFRIAPFALPGFRYDAVQLQLNFERIWVPWTTGDQRTIQMYLHTVPYANSVAWNDSALAERSVIATPIVTPLPAALPLFATGLGVLGLLGWRRKRKAAAVCPFQPTA